MVDYRPMVDNIDPLAALCLKTPTFNGLYKKLEYDQIGNNSHIGHS